MTPNIREVRVNPEMQFTTDELCRMLFGKGVHAFAAEVRKAGFPCEIYLEDYDIGSAGDYAGKRAAEYLVSVDENGAAAQNIEAVARTSQSALAGVADGRPAAGQFDICVTY